MGQFITLFELENSYTAATPNSYVYTRSWQNYLVQNAGMDATAAKLTLMHFPSERADQIHVRMFG